MSGKRTGGAVWRGWAGAAAALALSSLAHATGLIVAAPGGQTEMAGGAVRGQAALGDSFADLAAGHITSGAAGLAEAIEPVATAASPAAEVNAASAALPQVLVPVIAGANARAGAEVSARINAVPPPMAVTVAAAVAAPEVAAPIPGQPGMPAQGVPDAVAPALAQPQGAAVGGAVAPLAPVMPADRVVAADPAPVPQAPDATTLRPQARPARRSTQYVEAVPSRSPGAPDRADGTEPGGATGNSDRDAQRGQPDGRAAGRDAAGNAAKGTASVAGNAAATNYGGRVMQKIRATRKARGAGRGMAVVGFEIAGDGGLASARVVSSSGSAALDALALDHIRRSAPFPPPPPGAGRRYAFEFVGRS